ncbi:MAG: HAD-IC family P-type ATPase [Thermoleophilia bacterium]|nr:HAD-IC family P-type ATPase [Thermoleophilia bacterium]
MQGKGGASQPAEQKTEEIPWHSLTLDEIYQRLSADDEGLTADQAERRLQEHGPNLIESGGGPSLTSLALKQFQSPLIYMLMVAALISLLAQHFIDSGVIAAVLLLNAVIGVSQEWRAEKTLEALRKLSAPRARVLRDGEIEVLPAEQVVPGDVLMLETGDLAPADARVIESHEFAMDESALTGESEPVQKSHEKLDGLLALAERQNMIWSSTSVTGGRARAIVVQTGMQTALGEIAGEVQKAVRGRTPLQKRVASLGSYIGIAAVTVAVFIFSLGLLRGYTALEMMVFAAAAAVSAIPEGLPAVISVVLAVGVRRMAEKNAIIRRLPSVETLGSTTVICSDKTGTITRNEMTATRVRAGNQEYRLTGDGFSPEGKITPESNEKNMEPGSSPDLDMLMAIGVLANNATLELDDGQWKVQGNPTEGALLAAAHKLGLNPVDTNHDNPRLDEIPFSSKFKYMATLNRNRETGDARLLVKGGWDRILEFCDSIQINGEKRPLDEEIRNEIAEAAESYAADALRVIGGAYRELPEDTEEAERSEAEQSLIFVGLWGLMDPPRPEAIEAIAAAQRSGISVMMITGDQGTTAAAIADRTGITRRGERVVTGNDLDGMSDEELSRIVKDIGVFARVSPIHKFRIVEALEQAREVVAVTGDGVNDAPALKRADIGVAMGIAGTEVAKEAADMVLTDDNFATIVGAIEQGRIIFSNLRRVIMFLITTNLGEILTLIAALILGMPLPLTAVMILWINLVTDGMSVIPLGLEPKHEDLLRYPPRPVKEGILNRTSILRVIMLAPVIAIGTLGLFQYMLNSNTEEYARTVAFCTLAAFEWFRAVSTRSMKLSIFAIGFFTNRLLLLGLSAGIGLQLMAVYLPGSEPVFGTVPLALTDWFFIAAVASSVLVVDELIKLVYRIRERRAP